MQETMLMSKMTDQQKMMFLSEMSHKRKNTTTAVLLALFLGGFGAHHFYMGKTGLGILYLVFCWTFIPAIIALIECFLLPGRVRDFNSQAALEIAAQIGSAFPKENNV